MRAPDWVADVFASVDARDARRFASFLAEDAVFCFGNAAPVQGRVAVESAVRGFFSSILACRHEVLRFWQDGDACAMHGLVTYERLDGRMLTLPFANVFVMRGREIEEYRIYADLAALYAPG